MPKQKSRSVDNTMCDEFIRALKFRHIQYAEVEPKEGVRGVQLAFMKEDGEAISLYFYFNDSIRTMMVFASPLFFCKPSLDMFVKLNKANKETANVTFIYDFDSESIYANMAVEIVRVKDVEQVGMSAIGNMLIACGGFNDIFRPGYANKNRKMQVGVVCNG